MNENDVRFISKVLAHTLLAVKNISEYSSENNIPIKTNKMDEEQLNDLALLLILNGYYGDCGMLYKRRYKSRHGFKLDYDRSIALLNK